MSVTGVLSYNYLQRAGEILYYLIILFAAGTLKRIFYVWGLHRCAVPVGGESGAYDASPVEGLRCYAEQTFYQCSRCYASDIGEVAVGLPEVSVILGDLPEVSRAGAHIHEIDQVALQQLEAGIGSPCMEIGECHVAHFGHGHVVDAPLVRCPVGGGDCGKLLVAE